MFKKILGILGVLALGFGVGAAVEADDHKVSKKAKELKDKLQAKVAETKEKLKKETDEEEAAAAAEQPAPAEPAPEEGKEDPKE